MQGLVTVTVVYYSLPMDKVYCAGDSMIPVIKCLQNNKREAIICVMSDNDLE